MVALSLRTRRAVAALSLRGDPPATITRPNHSKSTQQRQDSVSAVAEKQHKPYSKAASSSSPHRLAFSATGSANPHKLAIAVNTGLAAFAAAAPATSTHHAYPIIASTAHHVVAQASASPAPLSSTAVYSIVAASSILLALVLSTLVICLYRRRRTITSDASTDVERGCLSSFGSISKSTSSKTISTFGCKDRKDVGTVNKDTSNSNADTSDLTLVDEPVIEKNTLTDSLSNYAVSPFMGCGAYKEPSIPVSSPTFQVDNAYLTSPQRCPLPEDDPNWHPTIPRRLMRVLEFNDMDLPAIIDLPEDVQLPPLSPTIACTGEDGAMRPPTPARPLNRRRVKHPKPNGFLAPPLPSRKACISEPVSKIESAPVKPVIVENAAIAVICDDSMSDILDSYSDDGEDLYNQPEPSMLLAPSAWFANQTILIKGSIALSRGHSTASDVTLVNDPEATTKMVKSASVESAHVMNRMSVRSTAGEVGETSFANISDEITMLEEDSAGTIVDELKGSSHYAEDTAYDSDDEEDDDLDPFALENDDRLADIVERVMTPTEEVFATADVKASKGRRRYESAKGTTFEIIKSARTRNSTAHGCLSHDKSTFTAGADLQPVMLAELLATSRAPAPMPSADSPDSLLSSAVVHAFAASQRAKSTQA